MTHPAPTIAPPRIGLYQMTDTLLRSVDTGIFFLNPELVVQERYSRRLTELLGADAIAGRPLTELLEHRVPEQAINGTREYLEALFRADLDVETIEELNPLRGIEVVYDAHWGGWDASRHLDFRFERIWNGDSVAAAIGLVEDVSERRATTVRLAEMADHTRKQMEWLVNIIHVEPELLREFFTGMRRELSRMDGLLRDARESGRLQAILESFRHGLYIIKGNASLLDLTVFTERTAGFLNVIADLKERDGISGSDFVPVAVQLGGLTTLLNEFEAIFGRIQEYHHHFRAKRSFESKQLVSAVENLIQDLSSQLGKQVQFDYTDLDALSIPYASRRTVRDILFLLVRNTILYGIEDPATRKTGNKSPVATIKISSLIEEKTIRLVLRHDGRIVRIERLLEKMLSEGADGSSEPRRADEGLQITHLLLVPNLPEHDEEQMLDNYSMDMDALRAKLREHRGRLKISFTSEQCCEFTVTLPIKR